MNILEKRKRLSAVAASARRDWFKQSGATCAECAKVGRKCAYPSHWNGETVDAAYPVLVGSIVPDVTPAPEPTPAPAPIVANVAPAPAPAPVKTGGAAGAFEVAIKAVLDEYGVGSREAIVAEIGALLPGMVESAVKSLPPKRHVIKMDGREDVAIEGILHQAFDEVLECANARIPILLVGPTGSGKTHLAAQVAQAVPSKADDKKIGLPFYFTSATAGMSEGVLGGRLLPTGEQGRFEYIISEFVKAYEQGGVFLLDEMDAADSNVLLKINAALANGHMTVDNRPGAAVATRHPDFIFIGAANTYGLGASRQYVGRNQLDGATLDRFVVGQIEVDYDKRIEERMVPASVLDWGWRVRSAIYQHGLRRTLSTRTLLNIASREAVGGTPARWKKSFFSGWKEDELEKIGKDLR